MRRRAEISEIDILKSSIGIKLQVISLIYNFDLSEIKSNNLYSMYREVEKIRNDITHFKSNILCHASAIPADVKIDLGTSKKSLATIFTQTYIKNCYLQILSLIELICSKCDLFGLNNYYDPKWIRNYITTFIELVEKHIAQKEKIILVGSHIESDSYIDFFRWNGIYIDSVVENVEQIKPGNFYIFIEYLWDQLELFREKCIGKDYVIFLKPNNFEYEHKMLLDSNKIIKCIELILREQTKDNLVVFGTGHNSEKLVKMLSLCPKFYVDNDVNKQGNEINGKKVFGAEKIYNNSYFIVVTPSQDEDIIKQLLENGIERKNIVRAKYLINKF